MNIYLRFHCIGMLHTYNTRETPGEQYAQACFHSETSNPDRCLALASVNMALCHLIAEFQFPALNKAIGAQVNVARVVGG